MSTKATAKILIVDDDKDVRITLNDALSELGYEVVTANHGQEALDILCSSSRPLPSVAVVDLKMPVMSGEEFGKIVRSYASFRNMPLIFITADRDRGGFEVEPFRPGRFLAKPFSIDDLDQAISDFLPAMSR